MRTKPAHALLAALLVATVAGFASALAASAQEPGEVEVAILDTDDSAFPVVTVLLTADANGRPVTGVAPSDVTVSEGGAPATVTGVEQASDAGVPLSLVIVIDTSGSMVEAMDAARRAATGLIASLGPDDSVAVVSFADAVTIVQPPTTDLDAANAAVAGLDAKGNTALFDAVTSASSLASESPGRRAVVLLSDGEDFGAASSVTRETALEAAADGGALFYVVGVGPDVDAGFLQALAELSGGRFFTADQSGADLAEVYESLDELLRSQLLVTFESSAAPDATSREVAVEVTVAGATGSATAGYESLREPAPTPTPTPTPSPTSTPALPLPENSDDGGILASVVAGAVGVALVGSGGGLLLAIRRRRGRSGSPLAEDATPIPARRRRAEALSAKHLGALILASAGVDERIMLDGAPVTIGSGADATVRLPGAPGVAGMHARLWFRDGSPILHHLAGGSTTMVNGRPADWASLADGDQLSIGPYTLTFIRPATSPGAPAPGEEASVETR